MARVAARHYYCLLIAGKTKCEICKKKCAGDILKADDKYFHIGCFTCKSEFVYVLLCLVRLMFVRPVAPV